ncbi:hypothetical protein AB0D04_02685 [Streptomyces sp. NPDC048483]|uniref:hypothetical protein n=1 Tax=Streptomyces sp. NPDC048483 TaxID=3154927 RepID=UPI0034136D73
MGRGTRTGLAGLAALAMVTVMPGAVGVAAAEDVPTYKPASGATKINGTVVATDAPQLEKGLHTDSIDRGEEKYYAVDLDARSSAYFSVVSAPTPGTKVEEYRDKLSIRVQKSDGTTCGSDTSQYFHAGGTAYPIAAYTSRDIGKQETQCQDPGPYYVVVTREGSPTSGTDQWPIELGYLNEPALKGGTPAQPGETSTTPPKLRTDLAKRRAGGTGFNDAASVNTGVWKDRIRPGETRFYQVPVDWGQRLNLSAELPNASSSKPGSYLSDALGLHVFNPARGVVVDDNFSSYNGEGAEATEFTAPVAYGNRLNASEKVRAMRFAGWYYLEVTLNSKAAQFFSKGTDFTLRVDVRGAKHAGPAYSEAAPDFTVTNEDREMARTGRTPEEMEESGTLRIVAYAGIGTGVVLLTGLGAWTLVARRRAAGAPGAPGTPGPAGALPQQAHQPPHPQQTQQGDQTLQSGPPQGR